MRDLKLSDDQQRWLRDAWDMVDRDRIIRLASEMINIPSPTGEEGPLAQFLVKWMNDEGFSTRYQPLDEHRGNAIGWLGGSGKGPTLLLYNHLDTSFTGDDEADFPVLGRRVRPDLKPKAYVQDDHLRGLGASNPKGPAACMIAALDAVQRSRVPLKGSVTVGLTAGGIHKCPLVATVRSYRGSGYIGQGVGCEFMLKHGVCPDFAISGKPGYAVSWEEPGMCWFRVEVEGKATTGATRTGETTETAITAAAKVILALEAWGREYTRRNTSEYICPQVSLSAVEAGWPYKADFVPALCTLYVDVRTNPHRDRTDAERQFGEAIDAIRASQPGIGVTWQMYLSAPGSATDPSSWIVRSCIRAWEAVEDRPHEARTGMSGASDTSILRLWGIPTARLGITDSKRFEQPSYGSGCNIDSMERLTRCYIYSIIDTCARELSEVNVQSSARA